MRAHDQISIKDFNIFFLGNIDDKKKLEDYVCRQTNPSFFLDYTPYDNNLIIANVPQLGWNQLGAFAAQRIAKGMVIGTFSGMGRHGVTDEEIEKMPDDNHFIWQFKRKPTDKNNFICDAQNFGSGVRFVNHSEKPNAKVVYNPEDDSIAYIAEEDIPAGAEITVSYGLNFFKENEKINYAGDSLQNILSELAYTYQFDIDIPEEFSYLSVEEIRQEIRQGILENLINDNFTGIDKYDSKEESSDFVMNEAEGSADIFAEQYQLFGFEEANCEKDEYSKQEKIPFGIIDTEPDINLEEMISTTPAIHADVETSPLTSHSIFASKERKDESDEQKIYLYLDKEKKVHRIQILGKGKVFFVDEEKTVHIPNIKEDCLVYQNNGKNNGEFVEPQFVEGNKTIKVEDTGVITNQHGNNFIYSVYDNDTKVGEAIKKRVYSGRLSAKRKLQEKESTQPNKKAKKSEVVLANETKTINEKEQTYVYLGNEDEKFALESIIFEKLNATKYHKITYNPQNREITNTTVLEGGKPHKLWDNRRYRCLVYAEGPKVGQFVEGDLKDRVEVIHEQEMNRKKNQFNEPQVWLTVGLNRVKLLKSKTYADLKRKGQLFAPARSENTKEKSDDSNQKRQNTIV